MAGFSGEWAFAFGLLGNIVSFLVYLSPLPTFYQIHKKKTSEGFQSVPYVVALFSAMLWIYYAFLKTNTTLIITINSVGCFIETIYICFYIFYASRKGRMQTLKLLGILVVCGFGFIVLLTQFLVKVSQRVVIVGWICLIFSLCVFIAPLCIVRRVIRTQSVEYMPFLLSLFLTLSAVMWFFYGFLIHDYNVAIPNVLGFTFGVLQMALYVKYRDTHKTIELKLPEVPKQVMASEEGEVPEIIVPEERKIPQLTVQIVDIASLLQSEKIRVDSPENINGVEASQAQKFPIECQV